MLTSDARTLFHSTTKEAAGDLQVKEPPQRFTAASAHPVTAKPPAVHRQKHHGSEKRQTVHMGQRVPVHVKLAYSAIAKQRGGKWTASSVSAEFLEEALEQNMGERFAQRIAAVVREAIVSGMKPYENRLAKLTLANLYETREVKLWLFEWFRAAMEPSDFQKLKKDFYKKARQLE